MSVILKSYPLSANLPPLPPIQAEPSQNIELVMLANPFQHSALIQDGERHLQGQSPLSQDEEEFQAMKRKTSGKQATQHQPLFSSFSIPKREKARWLFQSDAVVN
ncbi:predicted protein [Histoplasma capsulatum var. duboisii H88]|uniref:Predicted protein n=1 Tax=Ajellomyces capsulatus (strain H88) TaxID=544711 RepID=F0UQR1_AJEC8|nr:predicted protein [Histoplasma capsulatum var. duboisii H88]